MKKLFYLVIILFLQGCGLNRALVDPYSLAPKDPYGSWKPIKKEDPSLTKTFETYLPQNFAKEELTLAELINIALMNNPDTKKSWAQAMNLAASYGQSMKDYLPAINGDVSYMRTRQTFFDFTPISMKDFSSHYYETITTPELKVSYTLLDFGKRKNSTETARQALYFADWMHNQTIQDVTQNVMLSFYNYQYQLQEIKALEADLENAKTTLDAANEKFLQGVASLADVSQAKTSYLQTQINLTDQKNLAQNSFATLANSLGIPSNVKFTLLPFPDMIKPFELFENLDELMAKAEKNRPDLLALVAKLKSQEAHLAWSKKQFFPTVSGNFDIGKNYYNYPIKEDYHFTLLLKFTLPIFDGFGLANEVKKAAASLTSAKAELYQKQVAISQDVYKAYSDLQFSKENLFSADEYLQSAKEQYDIALANYKAGVAPILDLISAQASLANARSKRVFAQKQWFSSIVVLAYATGSLSANKEEIEKKGL